MSRAHLVWLMLTTIWGSTYLVMKVGLADLPPFTFAALRFLVALVPLLIFFLAGPRNMPATRAEWRLVMVTGLLTFFLNYGLVFWGANHISSGLTAILYTMLPLAGHVFAHFLLPNEPMTLKKTTGALLGVAGVAVIFSNQLRLDNTMAFWGAAAVVLATFSQGYAGVLVKIHGFRMDALTLTTGQMLVGFPMLMLTGWMVEGRPWDHAWTAKAWFCLIYLAILGSALAFWLLNWLIKNMDVTKTMYIPLSSTLIAVVLGHLFLDEVLRPRTMGGALLIFLGFGISAWGYRAAHQRRG